MSIRIPRREFRQLIAETWGKDGQPSGRPWFGAGKLVQHYAPSALASVAFCGRDIHRISSHPFRTLFGIHCGSCLLVVRRVNKRLQKESE